MKFNKYFFENYPEDTPFDEHNPRYVLSLKGADEVLEQIITHPPYSLSKSEVANEAITNALLNVEILEEKEGKIGIDVPFFTQKDTDILRKLSKNAARIIAEQLLEEKEKIGEMMSAVDTGFSVKRNLYHLLCGFIFDGLMFDYLEEEQLVTTACVHKSGLDYLVVLYEDCDSLNEYSNSLLCSYNRMIKNHAGFVSFGDSDGNRKDFYRYMRLKDLNQLSHAEQYYVRHSADDLIGQFKKLAKGELVDREYTEVYEYFGYCNDGKISVPVYDEAAFAAAEELYRFVLEKTKVQLLQALSLIEQEVQLSAIAYGINPKDIANEIYHLIFGEVNEILVQKDFVETPLYVQGQGRCLKAFEL